MDKFVQGTRKTRPCLTGHPVSEIMKYAVQNLKVENIWARYWEAAKKVLFLVDSPLRGGRPEGVRGCPLRKTTFRMFFFVAIEKLNIFCLRRHIRHIFNRFLEIFAKKYGSYSPKILENFFCQNPFPA